MPCTSAQGREGPQYLFYTWGRNGQPETYMEGGTAGP